MSSPHHQPDDGGVEGYLVQLEYVSRSLRKFGWLLIAIFILNLVFLALGATNSRSEFNTTFGQFYLTVSMITSAGGLLMTYLFDYRRKKGDTLFRELTDEIQWEVGGTGGSGDVKPPIEWRLILGEFADASDTPLVPGRYGPAVYAAAFLALILVAITFWPFV